MKAADEMKFVSQVSLRWRDDPKYLSGLRAINRVLLIRRGWQWERTSETAKSERIGLTLLVLKMEKGGQ